MIERLEWESDFFGIDCAQFSPDGEEIDEQMFDRYDWVQGKCYIGDEKSKYVFGQYNFVFEDTRVIFSKKVSTYPSIQLPKDFAIVESDPKDIERLQDIAKATLVDHSRLLVLLGAEETGRFYSEWVKKAVYKNFDDICFTIKHGDSPAGFITLKYKRTAPKIGLIAIDNNHQGMGLGKTLIRYTENFLAYKNLRPLTVITEGRNIQAQQFYIKYGFNIENIECWYYRNSSLGNYL